MIKPTSLTRQLGARVAELRTEKGWKQKELAARAELDGAYLSRLEHGKMDPNTTVKAAIAKALGISLSTLLEGVGPNRVQR
jgi:transcriptional regulator with XRE-family HTH domain